MKEWEIRVKKQRKVLFLVSSKGLSITATRLNGVFYNSVTSKVIIDVTNNIKL